MVKYSELVKKTMPPEKKASASKCVVGHYLVRPISNVISIPLIEKKVDPTVVTIISGIFPILALLSFIFIHSAPGFWIGWISIFIWNILDGVDGNIARYNDACSKRGELWDATVGWITRIAFCVGMGFEAFYHPGWTECISFLPDYSYPVLGCLAAMGWIFPRLVMQKKNVLMGEEAIKNVKGRANYSLPKLVFFNVTSINGLGAVIFLIAYVVGGNALCMVFYFLISMAVCFGSLYSLLK